MGVAALALAACGSPRPDLQRLYAGATTNGKHPPVVIIHGVFGAKFRRSGDGGEVWPGSLRNLIFGSFDELALPVGGEDLPGQHGPLEAYAITDSAAGINFYGRIIEILEKAGGYERAQPGRPVDVHKRHYYVFVYDWRRDNVDNARALYRMLRRIRADYHNQDLKFDIIAHSLGGLIARYFVRYGGDDVLDLQHSEVPWRGAGFVRTIILLGTPNRGSLGALQSLLEGFKIGLTRIPSEVLATMPSIYELLPDPGYPWLVDPEGERVEAPLFDVATWRRFHWLVFDPAFRLDVQKRFEDRQRAEAWLSAMTDTLPAYLERGRRFLHVLNRPVADAPVHYVVFGGTCNDTLAHAMYAGNSGSVLFEPVDDKDRAVMYEPGDDRVTKASLLGRVTPTPSGANEDDALPVDSSFLLCEDHDSLTGNISFQDNLLELILRD